MVSRRDIFSKPGFLEFRLRAQVPGDYCHQRTLIFAMGAPQRCQAAAELAWPRQNVFDMTSAAVLKMAELKGLPATRLISDTG